MTWKAAAVLSAVTLASPLATRDFGSVPGVNPGKRSGELTVYPVWLVRVPREQALGEHMDAGYAKALTPRKLLTARCLRVGPHVSSAGVK